MNADETAALFESIADQTETLLASVAAGTADTSEISNVLNARAELLTRISPESSLSANARTTLHRLLKLDRKLSASLDALRSGVRDRLAQARRRHSSSLPPARLVSESA